MESAFCLENSISYDIGSFESLPKTHLDRYRRSLVCNECKAKAYYRKKSKDGKPACFGAYHEDGFKCKSPNHESKYDKETIEEVSTLTKNCNVIDVNFSAFINNSTQMPQTARPTGGNSSKNGVSNSHSISSNNTKNVSKTIGGLLKLLVKTDTFKSSDIFLNIGKFTYKAKNLFLNFDQITEDTLAENKLRGYWGVISNADDEICWLNTSNLKDVSIPIQNFKDELLMRYKIIDPEQLAGAYVLVFGWLKESKKDSKKWFIQAHNNSSTSIAIILADG